MGIMFSLNLLMLKKYYKLHLCLAAVTVSPEREIYTVIEGNDLEVCLVIANNTPAVFQFHAIGYFYRKLITSIHCCSILKKNTCIL